MMTPLIAVIVAADNEIINVTSLCMLPKRVGIPAQVYTSQNWKAPLF